MASTKSDSEFDTRCPNCKGEYSLSSEDGVPKVLSCCHPLCSNCCELEALKNNWIKCSICDALTTIDVSSGVLSLVDHFPLLNELKRMELENCKAGMVLCDNCEESKKADWKCLQCDAGCANLCDGCRGQHNSLKALRTHEVIGMTDFVERSQHTTLMCPVHSEPIEVFCQDCHKTICCSCAVYQHQSHKRLTISEGATLAKIDLENHIEAVSGVVHVFNEEVAIVNEVKEAIDVQVSGFKESISASFADIHELLRAREDAVLSGLNTAHLQKTGLLHKQIANLREDIGAITDIVEYAERSLSCSADQILLSAPGTSKELSRLKLTQLDTSPCQLPDFSTDLSGSAFIAKTVATLGKVTDETLPAPGRCILQQESFSLVRPDCDSVQSDECCWDIVCSLTLLNSGGNIVTRDSGLTPVFSLQCATNEKKSTEKPNEDAPLESATLAIEDVAIGDVVDTGDADESETETSNNTHQSPPVAMNIQKTSFNNGVWTVVFRCSSISGILLSAALGGAEVKDSPISIRRGKPKMYFGNQEGTVGPHSNLCSGFLSSMSVENIRSLESNPVVWKRSSSLSFKKPFVSFIEMELTESPNCLLSHVILKNSKSEKYKLFYRSSSHTSSDAGGGGSGDGNCSDSDDTEGSESENTAALSINEWIPFDFLTPDWTDVKGEKVVIVDISEDQCKAIGYVNAIRLELTSTSADSHNLTNSFSGVNVYGWSIE